MLRQAKQGEEQSPEDRIDLDRPAWTYRDRRHSASGAARTERSAARERYRARANDRPRNGKRRSGERARGDGGGAPCRTGQHRHRNHGAFNSGDNNRGASNSSQSLKPVGAAEAWSPQAGAKVLAAPRLDYTGCDFPPNLNTLSLKKPRTRASVRVRVKSRRCRARSATSPEGDRV